MNSGGQTEEAETAYQILSYLYANPDAQDTLEGIVEWWLFDQKITQQTERVKNALAQLAARGLIVTRMGTDSQVHYGINRNKLDEIETLLRHSPRDADSS